MAYEPEPDNLYAAATSKKRRRAWASSICAQVVTVYHKMLVYEVEHTFYGVEI